MASTNVKVAVRCRPMSSREQQRGCGTIIEMNGNTVHINGIDHDHGDKDYSFDNCYYVDSTQEQVFEDLGEPVVNQALDGFNCTIFAYGQTGSGKSFSMMGSDDMPGIIPRLNQDLWKKVGAMMQKKNELGDSELKFMITVSFLEIYNEDIKDLLNPRESHMKIRESPDMGIYVEDLCEVVVTERQAVMQLISQGNAVRRVAATKMNDTSSRSHSVFTIKIEHRNVTKMEGGMEQTQSIKAKLNLVDLAGSERATKTGATGNTLKEGANINMSLMALGNVINALSEVGAKKKKVHIPYRDSKLTRLLQESLGGNAATVMVAAISPADYNYDETLSTLKYANRAKSIANAVVKNEDVNQKMIKDLKAEIERLKAAMSSGGGGRGDAVSEAQLRALEEEKKNSWEEKERLSKELNAQRQANMSVVMSKLMNDAKQEKVMQMKHIKKLGTEKGNLTKKIKVIKDKQNNLKTEMDKDMQRYKTMQLVYDELIAAGNDENDAQFKQLSADMAECLASIEKKRDLWKKCKDDIAAIKTRIDNIEEEITDERADLVTTAGILDANDKIREQIQEEERAKAKEHIEKEIEMARARLKEEAGAEADEKMERIQKLEKQVEVGVTSLHTLQQSVEELQAKLDKEREYSASLEEKLTDAEVEMEDIKGSLAEAKTLHDEDIEAVAAATTSGPVVEELQAKLEALEQDKYNMFKIMMDAFEKERSALIAKGEKTQQMLAQASKDLMFMAQSNDKLQSNLKQALLWEPSSAT